MKKVLAVIVALVVGMTGLTSPAWAADSGQKKDGDTSTVRTVILKECGEKAGGDDGEGIMCILDLAVGILTAGVAILGVLGIVISGIQYLTAGGSEEKTRKAKRRLFEIVIGLVAYAVMYAALKFLLPEFQ